MYDCPNQYHLGEQRISTLPACIKSIPHASLLDDHIAHVSLGNMQKQWKLFTRQMIRTHQLLTSLPWKPSALTHLLSALEAELNNLNSIHTSYQPPIQVAIQLLKKKPSFDRVSVSSEHMRRSLLPFLGDIHN